MSRSFKKNCWVNDHKRKTTKENKKLANRTIRRRSLEVGSSRSNFKKEYESWEITDYKHRWTKEEAIEDYYNNSNSYLREHFPTLKQYLNYWAKCALRK